MNTKILILAAVTSLAATGCTSTGGRTVYTRSQINQAHRIELGTVVGVRRVVIDGESTQIGLYGGGAVGAIGGSQVGSGAGSALGGVAGGVAGMVVGREVEKAMTRKEGLEITVALDDGSTVMIVQETDKGGFEDGDRVRVMIGQGTAYVMH
ncbi:MAG TPA: glycine zipper 2TM domain-containing protein [Opitutaceae bacterium]